ncbi:hypothetical protein CRUP_010502, partial [Coryphaenoides rupestris]
MSQDVLDGTPGAPQPPDFNSWEGPYSGPGPLARRCRSESRLVASGVVTSRERGTPSGCGGREERGISCVPVLGGSQFERGGGEYHQPTPTARGRSQLLTPGPRSAGPPPHQRTRAPTPPRMNHALLWGDTRGGVKRREQREVGEEGSVALGRCVAVDRRSGLVLESCERPTRRWLWAWMSRHRLYNLGAAPAWASTSRTPRSRWACSSATHPAHRVLALQRPRPAVRASQMKLAVLGRLVVPSRTSYHEWRRLGTPAEGPCSTPHEDVHTLLGNGQGMPCAFPFKYNNRWFSECTSEGREDKHAWCSTTPRYDQAGRWGFCPVQDSSCETFWESNQELQACYQFNLYTIVTWSQARASCRAQQGDLLSITSLAEHRYITGRLADVGVMVWIGLNHLTEGRGWQWSDGAPLSLINFTT